MALILNIYKKSYTEAVSSMGRAQAERAANLYVEAQGRNEKISTSFTEQKILNSFASTPFVRIDMITPVKKIKGSDGLYLERIYDFLQNGQIITPAPEDSNTQDLKLKKDDEELSIPAFDEFSYTTAVGKVSEIPADEKMISAQDALNYVRSYMDGSYKNSQSAIQKEKPANTCIRFILNARKDVFLLDLQLSLTTKNF